MRWYLANCIRGTSSLVTQVWVFAASVADLKAKLISDGYQFLTIADVK